MMFGSIADHADWQAVVQTLTNGSFIAKVLGQNGTGWTYGDRLVGDLEFSVPGFAAGRVEYDPGSVAASAEGEYGFLVNVTADPDTQTAQDAAVEIEDDVRVLCIY